MTTRLPQQPRRASAQPLSDPGVGVGRWRFVPPIGEDRLSVALSQMAFMLKSGLLLSTAVEVMANQETQPRLKEALIRISGLVRDGFAFSAACKKCPGVFPATVLRLIEVGERTGELTQQMQQAGEMLERKHQQARRIKQALTNPTITLVSCLVMIFLVIKFVMPRFLPLYQDMRVPLPPVTKLAIFLVQMVDSPVFLIVVAGLAVIVASQWKSLRQAFFAWALTVSWTRSIIGVIWAVSYCDTLAHLQKSGIPLIVAMDILGDTTTIAAFREDLQTANAHFKASGSLVGAIATFPYFPPVVASMAAVGEETGELDKMLRAASRLLEQQNEEVMSRVTSAIEPVVMLVLGSVMCFFFLSLFLPIYQIIGHLG